MRGGRASYSNPTGEAGPAFDDRPVGGAAGRGRSKIPGSDATTIGSDAISSKTLQQLLQSACTSGILKLANRNLTALPDVLLQLHTAVDYQGKKWWEEQDLTALDISHNSIAAFPKAVTGGGVDGTMDSMGIESLFSPAAGSSIRTLMASYNKFTLDALPWMYLSASPVAFAAIVKLDLSHNALGSPAAPSAVPSSRAPPVNRRGVTVPASPQLSPPTDRSADFATACSPDAGAGVLDVSPLVSLRELNCSHNQLKAIRGLTCCKDLQSLDLSDNNVLTDFLLLPSASNGSPSAPATANVNVRGAGFLGDMGANSTGARSPAPMGALDSGRGRLANTMLRKEPYWPSLRQVNVSGNAIELLPLTFFLESPSLAVADWSRNSLRGCSRQPLNSSGAGGSLMGEPVNPTALAAEPPTAIAMSPSLRVLNLRQNKLNETVLPASVLHGMPQLVELHLASNAFTALPFPPVALLASGAAPNSTVTAPPGCAPSATPYVYWARPSVPPPPYAKTLSFLDASSNQLNNVDSICALSELTRLEVTNNDLSTLPGECGLLKKMTTIGLDGNPMRGIRREVWQKGTKELLAYLRSRLPEGIKHEDSAIDASARIGGGGSLVTGVFNGVKTPAGGGTGTTTDLRALVGSVPMVGSQEHQQRLEEQQRQAKRQRQEEETRNNRDRFQSTSQAAYGAAAAAPTPSWLDDDTSRPPTLALGTPAFAQQLLQEQQSQPPKRGAIPLLGERGSPLQNASFGSQPPSNTSFGAAPTWNSGPPPTPPQLSAQLPTASFIGKREGELWNLSCSSAASLPAGRRAAAGTAAAPTSGSLPDTVDGRLYVLSPALLASHRQSAFTKVSMVDQKSMLRLDPTFLLPLVATLSEVDVSGTGLTSLSVPFFVSCGGTPGGPAAGTVEAGMQALQGGRLVLETFPRLRTLTASKCQLYGDLCVPQQRVVEDLIARATAPGALMKPSVSFIALPSLTALDISHNPNLTSISGAWGFHPTLLPNLSSFNAAGCGFVKFPISILAFSKLTVLILASNKLVSPLDGGAPLPLQDGQDFVGIPREIETSLPLLQTLDLSYNDLSSIPAEIGRMPKLSSLLLHGNRIKWLRQATIDRGTVAILQFLKERIPPGA